MDPETRSALTHLQDTTMEHHAQLKTHSVDIAALKMRPRGNMPLDVRLFAFLTFCLVALQYFRQ